MHTSVDDTCSQRFLLPSGHGGPEGTDPQPMTPPLVVQSVGEEVPLPPDFGRLYKVAVHQHYKQSRAAMHKLPPHLRERARNDRKLKRLEWMAGRSKRQSKKDKVRAYGQRETDHLTKLTIGA